MDTIPASKDDIEDWSDGEGNADFRSTVPPALTSAPSGVAERFETYLGARPSDGTIEGDHNAGLSDTDIPKKNEDAGRVDIKTSEQQDDFIVNEDGTFTGGDGDDLQNFLEGDRSNDPNARRTDDRNAEDMDISGDEADFSPGETPLPEEPWRDRPPAERELWERVRTRPLRREAARVRDLKFPTTTFTRLMRVHPDMDKRTPESLEVMNYATVLLLQALARATVRGGRQTVRLEDIKQVCLNNRELHFLLPLSATFDASTFTMSHHDPDNGGEANGKAAAGLRASEAGPGQSTLSSATFARSAAPARPAQMHDVPKAAKAAKADEGLDVVTVQGNLALKEKTPQHKAGGKRKLPPSATKEKPTKTPRQDKEPKVLKMPASLDGSSSITSFFKRASSD
jgi:hypothetical protein